MKVCVKCKGVVSVGGSRSTIERPPLLLLEMMVNAYAGVVALALDDLAEVMGIADHGGTPGIFFRCNARVCFLVLSKFECI
jgi:hypothetical protein